MAQGTTPRRRGVGFPGILALVVLAAGIAGAAWLLLTDGIEPAANRTAEVVLDLPPPPPAPAAATPPAETAAVEPPPAAVALPELPDAEPSAMPPPEATAAAATEPTEAPSPATEETLPAGESEVAAVTPPPVPETAVDPASLPAWKRFARDFPANDVRPRIAIVITALGQKEDLTLAAIQQLPPEVTLSFSPYSGCTLGADGALLCSQRLADLIAAAREAGHEVLLDLPMEPRTYPSDDPGPQALLTSLDAGENTRRLDWVLGRADGYVGVATYMGSRFTASADHLRPVLRELNDRGLLFLDSRYGEGSAGPKLAAEIGVPRAVNDRFLDTEPSRAAIDAKLAQLERQAREKGSAVAMALPYPVTVERISGWAKALVAKGVALAPISALADTRAAE